MKLEEIGFYTLDDNRAKTASSRSPLHRCELLITSRCNFHCPYCRGLSSATDLPFGEAMHILGEWAGEGLRNVRFSGGEPMLYGGLEELVAFCRRAGMRRIALSTNGSFPLERYLRLVEVGVNDFSISLDACCSDTFCSMSGEKQGGIFDTVVSNLRELSSRVYTTVGVVLTGQNRHEVREVISLATATGCADIRIIPAAQCGRELGDAEVPSYLLAEHPILRYRMRNVRSGKAVRGLQAHDSSRCPLVLDDMAVFNGCHFPCIIYLREGGKPIGSFANAKAAREDRLRWYNSHDCQRDPICKNNCLDVCIDYNNRWNQFHIEHDAN